MKPNTLKKISLTTILIFFLTGILYAENAKAIVEKAENAMRGRTQISLSTITIKTRRWTRIMEIKSWEIRKQKKSFSVIIAPKKDAGNRFLLIKNSMRHFIPKLQRVIKISPSMMLQSWMGSDFSNDDILKESSKVSDYTHSIISKEETDGHLCYKIKLTPKKNAAVVWGKILYYIRVKDYLPVREEMYNQHNVLKKVMTFSKVKRMGGRLIPTQYKMQTIKKKDQYTIMEIKKIVFNKRISSRVFSIQNLKRR